MANALAIGGNFNLGGAAGTNLGLSAAMNLATFVLTHNQPSNDTLSGALTNGAGGGITVTAGTLNLTGNNAAYTGTTGVTGGTLNMAGTNNYAAGATLNVTGGTVNMNGTGGQAYATPVTMSGGTVNMNATGGAGATYTGATTVTGGTLGLSSGTFTGVLTQTAGSLKLYRRHLYSRRWRQYYYWSRHLPQILHPVSI